jgi:hypothetical protein
VDAQGHRQRPGQRMEAVIGGFGQQLQQLAQFLALGGCLPETSKGGSALAGDVLHPMASVTPQRLLSGQAVLRAV